MATGVQARSACALAFERLGGAWIKLGQMLALRFDLLPADYCDELFKLLNQVEPFSYDEVRLIIRQELGADPETIFQSFSHASFAAASIGQVHRAVLHSGDVVAVKVQRPGIRTTLAADIALMYSTTRILDWTHVFGATRSREVIDEFARWTADELDYLVEARQAVLLYQNAQGDKVERIARVHRDYTTSRVLTTELIVGIPLIDIMIAKREGNTAYLEALAARGHDLDRIVRNLDWNMLNQVYVFGYFHADLHPANLFVLPGDAIGYVDFGIVGQLPDRVRDSLTRYSWLLFRGEVESAVLELMRWLAPGPSTDIGTTRRQLIRVHQAFLYDTVADRLRTTAEAPGPARHAREPVFEAGGRHPRHDPRPAADDVGQHRRLPQDAGHARHAPALRSRSTTTCRTTSGASSAASARQQGLALLDPRRTFDRLYAGDRPHPALDGVPRVHRGPGTGHHRGDHHAVRLPEPDPAGQAAVDRLRHCRPGGRRPALPGPRLPGRHPRGSCRKEVDYTWFQLGLLAVLLVLIVNLIRNMRSMGGPGE